MKPKYTVVLSRQTERFYKKLEGKEKASLRECLISLQEDAYVGKRLHVGKLRIIYSVSEKDRVVSVIAIGPRRSVYQ